MDLLNVTIQHKLTEKYPTRSVQCLAEIDPITFKPFFRLIFEGRKTHFTYQPDALTKMAEEHNMSVDEVASTWVSSVHGVEQMLLQNRIEV